VGSLEPGSLTEPDLDLTRQPNTSIVTDPPPPARLHCEHAHLDLADLLSHPFRGRNNESFESTMIANPPLSLSISLSRSVPFSLYDARWLGAQVTTGGEAGV
jgi:hypothetical protein